jgi:hypothetical protein
MPGRRARASFHGNAAARKEISGMRARAHFGATQHSSARRDVRQRSFRHLTAAVSCFDILSMHQYALIGEEANDGAPLEDLLLRVKRKAAAQGRTLTPLIKRS